VTYVIDGVVVCEIADLIRGAAARRERVACIETPLPGFPIRAVQCSNGEFLLELDNFIRKEERSGVAPVGPVGPVAQQVPAAV
jgi:hypothetical protein